MKVSVPERRESVGDNQRGGGSRKDVVIPLGVVWGMSSGHFVIDRDGDERVVWRENTSVTEQCHENVNKF